MNAKSAPSVLYDYYNPDARTAAAPVRFRIEAGPDRRSGPTAGRDLVRGLLVCGELEKDDLDQAWEACAAGLRRRGLDAEGLLDVI